MHVMHSLSISASHPAPKIPDVKLLFPTHTGHVNDASDKLPNDWYQYLVKRTNELFQITMETPRLTDV
jgi:hypothetical protein